MRTPHLIATAAALCVALGACQPAADDMAAENATEAVEAAGVADHAAATTSVEQAAADARAAAEAPADAAPAPAERPLDPVTPEPQTESAH